MSPFDAYAFEAARTAVAALRTSALTTNRLFVQDDHWQGGAGWNGPLPSTKYPVAYQRIMAEIERAFTSENIIGEFVERHVAGVVGQEPKWSLTFVREIPDGEEPAEPETNLKKEAEALLTAWWDRQRIHQDLQEAIEALCWATIGPKTNQAPLRLFVPPAFVQQWVDGKTVDFAEALQNIYLEVPPPESLTLVTDRASMRQAGLYLYEDATTHQPRVELVYMDEETGGTVVRMLGSNPASGARMYPLDEDPNRFELALGKRLLHFVMQRRPLFGESVRRLQKSLNKSLTMMDENQNNAGWLERIIINGRMTEDAEIGPHVVQEIVAAFYDDVVNGEVVKKPLPVSVIHRQPVGPETFLDTQAGLRAAILRQASQLHVLISGDATASGESRIQARADYLVSLLLSAIELAAAGRWLLETALALAAWLAGKPEHFAELRAVFTPRIDPGPVPPDELRVIIEMVKARLWSAEYGRAASGVEDVDAEAALILGELEANIEYKQMVAALMQTVSSTFGKAAAVKYAGIEDEKLEAVLLAEPETPEPDSNPANEVDEEKAAA